MRYDDEPVPGYPLPILPGHTSPGRFERILRAGSFAVTTELAPPDSADPEDVFRRARVFDGYVDAMNATDGSGANCHMSSLAVCALLTRVGYAPIMQISCRDKNRIAIQGDILGGAAMGVCNILCLTGDGVQAGDHPQAKPVFDLDCVPFEFRGASLDFASVARRPYGCERRGVDPARREFGVRPAARGSGALALYTPNASYYLGRSIDNNLLNIIPFVVLALLAAMEPPLRSEFSALGAAAVRCVIALTLSFGWSVWWGPALARGHAFEVDPRAVRKAFDLASSETTSALDRRESGRNPLVHSADIQSAAAQIWATYHEPVTLMARRWC